MKIHRPTPPQTRAGAGSGAPADLSTCGGAALRPASEFCVCPDRINAGFQNKPAFTAIHRCAAEKAEENFPLLHNAFKFLFEGVKSFLDIFDGLTPRKNDLPR